VIAPAQRLDTVAVALRLRVKYLKARDLMLSGKLGECERSDRQHLTVTEAGVLAFLDRKKTRGLNGGVP
jgi:hypothetical protein